MSGIVVDIDSVVAGAAAGGGEFDMDAVVLDVVVAVVFFVELDCSDFMEALNLIHNFLMPLVSFVAGAALVSITKVTWADCDADNW